MKKFISLVICFGLAYAITFLLPEFFNTKVIAASEHNNEVSILPQKIENYGGEKHTYHKLYENGVLVGVINDIDYFYELIDEEAIKYADSFPNSKLGLTGDVYIVDESSDMVFEDIDKNIVNYLNNNDLLGVSAKAVEFSNSDGIYDIIYVLNEDDFIEARDQFFLNFVSKETIQKIENKETINSPLNFGSVEMSLNVAETMTFKDVIVSPDEIFETQNEIYTYLCYGRSSERQYYETREGDTVQAVGYYFGDMTAKQVMMLNPDILSDEDQLLAPGTVLNVTYYNSPITVTVVKHRLTQETVLPDSPLYIEDASIKMGNRVIEREESNGVANSLYEEIWVNGVIQSGSKLSSSTIVEPIQGIIKVGTMRGPEMGTGNFTYPVDNPILTCHFTCYVNHRGVDFQNMYNKYGSVIAADSGVVEGVGYTDIGGYYVRINHNNGFITYYGHMRTSAYVEVGQTVERGEVIGPIGMTGVATGPHVHFAMYYNETLIDPCTQLACKAIPWS